MSFSLYYIKNKNDKLFRDLENSSLELYDIQNYIPLYENFFSLNINNFNSINLNSKYSIQSILNVSNSNTIHSKIVDLSNNKKYINVFCKFAPLLDPLKYLTGKYDISDNIILPSLNETNCIPKLLDKNNNSYVDSFFSYLSSQLLHNYNFINSIDFYGSFICKKKEFYYNIVDDVEYLNESEYFHKQKNTLFKVDNDEFNSIFNIDSRTNKQKLLISEKIDNIELNNISELDIPLFTHIDNNVQLENIDLSNTCIYSTILEKKEESDDSTCSSKSSNTTLSNELSDIDNDEESDDENNSFDDSSCDSLESNEVICKINNYPIQLICLEKCENTLDYLMENNLLNTDEWTSCLFQVILSLTVFQKSFMFTHNDLHTNNIMYIQTEKQFIYYKYNNIHYKIPTYGKIYKIIDYGRAIYKYDGKTMCSDSFHPKGDAASQYNCEPYFDTKKPRLEPNFSFDLCRLACCIFDYFVDDISETQTLVKKNKLLELIYSWLKDDKGRNILYKNDGEERYPEFKLYKMIARTVHNAIPEEQLKHDIFKKYIVNKKSINSKFKSKIINLDLIPKMYNKRD